MAAAACAERDPTHVRNDGAMRERGGAREHGVARRVIAQTERRHDEGQDSEIRVELPFGEGVYSGLGPSRGDLSRRERGQNAIAGASNRTDETVDGKASA